MPGLSWKMAIKQVLLLYFGYVKQQKLHIFKINVQKIFYNIKMY